MSSREEEVPVQMSLTVQEWEDLADICQYWIDDVTTRFFQPRHDRVAKHVRVACDYAAEKGASGG